MSMASIADSYRVLVRHFFAQFFDSESLSPQAESTANLGPILGLLAVPGAFIGLLLQPLTLTGWALITFRYFFIGLSMVVMGFIVVFKWDSLFPDRRDYFILTPLPLHPILTFLAKTTALGLLLSLFLVDVNLFGTLFWPGIDTGRDTLRIFWAHTVSVLAAGLFAALAAATIQGVLINLLSPAAFRRVSVWMQTVLLGLLIMFLFLTPLIGHRLEMLARTHSAFLYYFPGAWFIGLYERLRPATGNRVLLELGEIGIKALWWSAAMFAITYVPAYRRHSRRMLEMGATSPSGPGRGSRLLCGFLHRFVLRTPVERGVFHFIGQTITRSMKHRIFLAGYGGFGLALGLISLLSGESGLLRLPLTLSFILVSGLRAAFNFPSELRANWAFQVSEGRSAHEYLAAMRKWIVLCGVVPLCLLLAPIEFYFFPWKSALFHLSFGFTLSVLMVEVMFFDFRKVAFTCAYFPGRMNFVGLSVIYVFGFTAYSRTMAALERLLIGSPVLAGVFFALAAVACIALARWRDRELGTNASLDYEGAGDPTVRSLELASH